MKHFKSRVDAVGDQELKSSFICMSPLTHTLAFNLPRPPYEFNFVFNASLTGSISSAGIGLSFGSKVSFSNNPWISPDMADLHFSFTAGDNLNI